MKKWISGAAMVVALSVAGQRAQASVFVDITDGTVDKSCDNSVSIATCTANGFFTNIGSNTVFYTGSVGGYSIGGITVNANVPGGITGLVSDAKVNITNVSDASDLIVTFAAQGFTSPTGTNIFSASHTGNWSTSVLGDSGSFKGWADNTNGEAPFVGTLADTGTCASPGGSTVTCGTQSPNAVFTNAGSYSLVGREVIHLATGSSGNFTATETLSAVPEPVTFSLMGIGLLGLGVMRRRLR